MAEMKIGGAPVAPKAYVSAETTPKASSTPAETTSKATGHGVVDGFESGIKRGGCFPPYPGPITPGPIFPPPGGKVTLNLHDMATGSKLRDALSSPINDIRLALGKQNQTLHRGADGVMRGPEGQPLVTVKLKDGNTAYVDPNTNQYYLTNHKEMFGTVKAMGPLSLPKGAQFSNSHFSDADVKALQKYANGGGIIPHPIPEPIPYPGPKPMPQPFPFPGPRPLPIEIKPLPQPLPPVYRDLE